MKLEDLHFAHSVAHKERAIRSLEDGDHVTVKCEHGEYAGHVEKVNEAVPGEGNYVVVIDAVVYNGDAQGADIHTLTIDFEGAFESEYPYYLPYIVATAGDRTLGAVKSIQVEPERDEVAEWVAQ